MATTGHGWPNLLGHGLPWTTMPGYGRNVSQEGHVRPRRCRLPDPVVLLDRDEAATRLHVSARTIRRYGKSGLLDERRIGPRLIKVTEESVNKLIHTGKDRAA